MALEVWVCQATGQYYKRLVDHRNLTLSSISFMYNKKCLKLGNVSNVWKFIYRTSSVYLVRHACFSVSSSPGGMLNNRIPLPTATGCMRLRSAAHTLGEQYALPRALKGPPPSRFPSHPPLKPQRHLSFSITLVHTVAVLRILLLSVLISLPSPGSMRDVWRAGEMLGTRWIEVSAL